MWEYIKSDLKVDIGVETITKKKLLAKEQYLLKWSDKEVQLDKLETKPIHKK